MAIHKKRHSRLFYRRYLAALVALCVVLLPLSTGGQGKGYQIGPADVLNLTIFAGGEKQHDIDLTVSPEGTINAPFIGSVKAAGLTTSQLENSIAEPLERDYLVNPKVTVHIKEFHSLHYYISGAISQPGLYEMTSETSLLALIAKSGGVLPDRGPMAYVMRESGGVNSGGGVSPDKKTPSEPIKIDLQRLLDQGDLSANIMLKPGDMVYIPLKQSLDQSQSKIYVDGEVTNPGVYDFQPGITALNACILAGGFTRFAAPNRAFIIRKLEDSQEEKIKIRLDDVKGGEIPDVALQPGDRVHVPETWL